MKSALTSLGLVALALTMNGCGTHELTELSNVDPISQLNEENLQQETHDLSLLKEQRKILDESMKVGTKVGGVIVVEKSIAVEVGLKLSPVPNIQGSKIPAAACTLPIGVHLTNISPLRTGGLEAQVHYPKSVKVPQSRLSCSESAIVVIQGKAASRFRGLAIVANTTSFEMRNKFDNSLPRVFPKQDVPDDVQILPVGEAKELALSMAPLPKPDNSCSVYANRSHLRISGTHRSGSGQIVFSAKAVGTNQPSDRMFRMNECEIGTQLSTGASEIAHALSQVTAFDPTVIACEFPLPSEEK